VRTLISSMARCPTDPGPTDPYVSSPGLDLASAMRASTLDTPSEGCTARMSGRPVSGTTGARSLTKSNCRLELVTALVTFVNEAMNNV